MIRTKVTPSNSKLLLAILRLASLSLTIGAFTSFVHTAHCKGPELYLFFFFQAEDGIRYLTVTGVQTCALSDLTPISCSRWSAFAAAAAIATPSVISSVRRFGSTLKLPSARATISSSEWSSMFRGETFRDRKSVV